MQSFSAVEVALHFVHQWVINYSSSHHLLADNRGEITSNFFQEVWKLMIIHNSYTMTYRPQANGQVERCNHTILVALRMSLLTTSKNWTSIPTR